MFMRATATFKHCHIPPEPPFKKKVAEEILCDKPASQTRIKLHYFKAIKHVRKYNKQNLFAIKTLVKYNADGPYVDFGGDFWRLFTNDKTFRWQIPAPQLHTDSIHYLSVRKLHSNTATLSMQTGQTNEDVHVYTIVAIFCLKGPVLWTCVHVRPLMSQSLGFVDVFQRFDFLLLSNKQHHSTQLVSIIF